MEIQFKTRNPKQLEAAKAWLDDNVSEIVYGGGKGGGKVVSDYGFVLTPFGFKQGKDLVLGDLITNPDGSVQKIIQIKDRETLQLARVTFSDGTFTDVAPAHLWTAWKSNKTRKINNIELSGYKSGEVVETQEIKKWLERGYKPQIPVCNEVPFNNTSREKNRIDPYLLGLLLGDGCITTKAIAIASDKKDIPHYLSKIGEDDITVRQQFFNFIGDRRLKLVKKLTDYGLMGTYSHNKFIPKRYKYSDVNTRYEIIRGLMDTDGFMPKGKHSCYYYSVSKQLADDVAFILRSLGSVVTITTKQGKYKKDGILNICRICYCLHIKHREPSKLFSLPRKMFDKSIKNISKGIISVEFPEEEVTGRCITVSNPNGLYITNDFIVTHNSYLGATLIFGDALIYPDTHYFIARGELNDLRKYTIPTIYEVFQKWGLKVEDYMTFNGQDNCFKLYNGSKVFLISCKEIPSDPLYERFGSMQMTRGWIEEAGEVCEAAKENLYLSIGRWKNDVYKLKKKLLMTCNPKKGWLKRNFVDPFKAGVLDPSKRYIQALVGDNPYLSKDYVETLANQKDPTRRARLYEGDWEYDDDKTALLSDAEIDSIFTNEGKPGKKYMTIDPAFQGKDELIIYIWDGYIITHAYCFPKMDENNLIPTIDFYSKLHSVERNKICSDATGVGSFVPKFLKGIRGFIGASSAIKDEDANVPEMQKPFFANLRSQCIWEFSQKIKKGVVAFKVDNETIREKLREELEQWKVTAIDNDRKIQIISKDDIKEIIGRSTDYSDALYEREFFELDADAKRGIDEEVIIRQNKVNQQTFNNPNFRKGL